MTSKLHGCRVAGVTAVALVLSLGACGKSEAPKPTAEPASAQEAAPAQDPAGSETPATAEQPGDAEAPAIVEAPAEAEAPAADPDAAGEESAGDATESAGGAASKATLAKAYVEIYCAQRAGDTEKLLDIYTSYGFAEPAAWTKAWTEAAKDSAWVARITQDAIKACP